MGKKIPRKKKETVEWLRLCSSTAEGMGLKIKILHALWLRQKKKGRKKKHEIKKEGRKGGKKEGKKENKKSGRFNKRGRVKPLWKML